MSDTKTLDQINALSVEHEMLRRAIEVCTNSAQAAKEDSDLKDSLRKTAKEANLKLLAKINDL